MGRKSGIRQANTQSISTDLTQNTTKAKRNANLNLTGEDIKAWLIKAYNFMIYWNNRSDTRSLLFLFFLKMPYSWDFLPIGGALHCNFALYETNPNKMFHMGDFLVIYKSQRSRLSCPSPHERIDAKFFVSKAKKAKINLINIHIDASFDIELFRFL